MDIELCDGSIINIDGLQVPELRELQWEQERAYAGRICSAPKGSPEREQITQKGYEAIGTILLKIRQLESPGENVHDFSPSSSAGRESMAKILASLLEKRAALVNRRPFLFEIGCGSGNTLSLLANAGYEVGGIEPAPNLLEMTQKKLPEECAKNLFCGTFLRHELWGQQKSIDAIVWEHVMEHIPTDEIADYLSRTYELLVPGGMLVTSTPNWHRRPSDITLLFDGPRSEPKGFHLKEYTLREMVQLLKEAGYQRVYTPLLRLPSQQIILVRGGLAAAKIFFEPWLEYFPFRLARILCQGLGLEFTIAVK